MKFFISSLVLFFALSTFYSEISFADKIRQTDRFSSLSEVNANAAEIYRQGYEAGLVECDPKCNLENVCSQVYKCIDPSNIDTCSWQWDCHKEYLCR